MSEMYPQDVKDLAHKLDPLCWVSYSGQPREYRRMIDVRRTAALRTAKQQLDAQRNVQEIEDVILPNPCEIPKDGGPAAPVETSLGPGQGTLHFNGLSVRQAYKMVALHAVMTDGSWKTDGKAVETPDEWAKLAADIADAMLDEDSEFAEKNQS